MREKAVSVISGGLDSTVATAIAKDRDYDLYLIFFDYGQKTVSKEKALVPKLAEHFGCSELKIVEMPWIKNFGNSALLDPDTPLDEQNFIKEYVPFRNTQFLSIATAWAEVIDARAIFVGSTGGDHICPDNTKSYLDSFQKVISEGTLINKNIRLEAPLVDTDKTGAVKIGLKLNVPFNLTWSCHNNIDYACGHCSNCKARLEAFLANNLKDPINYGK